MRHLFSGKKYLTVILLSAMAIQAERNSVSTALQTITGMPKVKVVFTRSSVAHEVDFPPNNDFQADGVLVGISSDDGKEDTLQTTVGNYQNPLITHDGKHIVYTRFSSGDVSTYIVDWTKNATPKKITKGMTGCLWYNPVTKKEYIIYEKVGKQLAEINTIYKKDIADTLSDSLVLRNSKTIMQWLRVSADCNAFAGCMGDYGGNGGPLYIVDREGQKIVENPSGCWPTMPFDNSHRLVKTVADHDKWQVKGPDDSEGVDLNLNAKVTFGQFSQLRMASYFPNIFLIVVNAPGGDNGTGDIEIVKTDSTLLNVITSVTIAKNNCHYADLWADSVSTNVKLPNNQAHLLTNKSGNSVMGIFAINGKRVLKLQNADGLKEIKKSSGFYIRAKSNDNQNTLSSVSVVK